MLSGSQLSKGAQEANSGNGPSPERYVYSLPGDKRLGAGQLIRLRYSASGDAAGRFSRDVGLAARLPTFRLPARPVRAAFPNIFSGMLRLWGGRIIIWLSGRRFGPGS